MEKTMTVGKLLVSPFIGLAFVLSMPLIGIAMFVGLLVRMSTLFVYRLTTMNLTFGWRPRHAFLAGKKKNTKGEK